MPKIVLTDFAKERLFDPKRGGTCISDRSPEYFEQEVNRYYSYLLGESENKLIMALPGYAPFCNLLVFENWTNANAGTVEITDQNRHLLRSDYIARTEKELPVLTRWLEMESLPRAKYLIVITYDADQMAKEGNPIDGKFGIVAVLGQMHDEEEPMPPITAMRNALGVAEGGSGVSLDREAYLRSVEFWRNHAVVKRSPTSEGQKA
jgi:hypothetical protein